METDINNQHTFLTVTSSGQGKFEQRVISGEHTFIVDEPSSLGGNDGGPSPYDLILAALGACTSMTLNLYAKLKKIPLEKVTVKLSHSKIHAKDCVECEDKVAKIDYILREIEVKGDLSEEQKKALLAIANKCPVHQTLTSKIDIDTELF